MTEDYWLRVYQEWRWEIVDRVGETVASGKGYETSSEAKDAGEDRLRDYLDD